MDSCERLSRGERDPKNHGGSYQNAAAPTIPTCGIARRPAHGASSTSLKPLAIAETIGYDSGIKSIQPGGNRVRRSSTTGERISPAKAWRTAIVKAPAPCEELTMQGDALQRVLPTVL